MWWGGNGIGKSEGLAEWLLRCLECSHSWMEPGPHGIIVAGNTMSQLGSTLKYIWNGVDRSWFRETIRYEAGELKGQRIKVYDIVGGPCKGGELRCGTFKSGAESLAGPRATAIATDEPLPEKIHNELMPRLLGRNGRMLQTFTPTISTEAKLQYLWDLVDDKSKAWAGDIQTELTLENVTPIGGLGLPWMRQAEIDRLAEGVSHLEADMRLGRTRHPRRDDVYFNAWGPHLVAECHPTVGSLLGIGIDHGSKPGAERAVLVAIGGRHLRAQVWVLDEYKGDGRTETEADARGIIQMIHRNGFEVGDIDRWVGDRAHRGDRKGGLKSNHRLQRALAKAMGINVNARKWSAQLPEPLRKLRTPWKYERSVWEGCEVLHRLMVGKHPRITVSPRCGHLAEDLSLWEGGSTDPHKDGIDAMRYIVTPLVEGRKH